MHAEPREQPAARDPSALQRALDRLEPAERVALRGHFVERRTIAEIASELGIPEAEAAALRTRALLRLARILGDATCA